MKNILVYNCSGELDDITHLFPSERLGRIAAIAAHQGHAVRVIDRGSFAGLAHFGADFMTRLGGLTFRACPSDYNVIVEREADELLRHAPDLLFANLWQGSGFKFTFDLVRALRVRRPALRIYGVGQKVDWFGAHILNIPDQAFDGLVSGLGYATVAALCADRPPVEIPALIYARNGQGAQPRPVCINPDEYPEPLYDAARYPDVQAKIPVFTLTLSNQACPNRCAYCVRPANYGRQVVRRDIAAVLREMQTLVDAHGVTHFRIEDSTPPPRALTELARGILTSPLRGRVWLSAFSRVDANSQEDFTCLHDAGFVSLFFGIESLDESVLTRLDKGITVQGVRDTLMRAHAAGIRTVGSFIFPTPGETAATMACTLSRIAELKPCLDSALVLPAGVYPPTPWGEHPEQHGILLDPDFLEKVIIYPVKYLVPLRHWPPFPLRFDLMGKPAAQVSFEDIIDAQDAFLNVVRKELGIPGIPDYYFLIAHLLSAPAAETARGIVAQIMTRNYTALAGMFGLAAHASGERA